MIISKRANLQAIAPATIPTPLHLLLPQVSQPALKIHFLPQKNLPAYCKPAG